jgi:3-isopropylmalate/(R)-2-methylmalate dehydratase small subunit
MSESERTENSKRRGWVFEGRCWKFGDNMPNDGGLMDKDVMSQLLEYNPETLAPLVLSNVRPEFAKDCRPGDIAVFGKRFAHGNPHIQGPLGMKGLGIAVLAEGMQRSTFRLLISAGVPFIPHTVGVRDIVEDGDRIRVNIATGAFENLTNGRKTTFEPLPDFLLEVIEASGSQGHLDKRLREEGKIPA